MAFFTRRRSSKNLRTKRSTNPTSFSQLANQGNQGRAQDTAKITTRRKSSEWSAFWKSLLRRYCRVRHLPDNANSVYSFLEIPRFARDFGCGLPLRSRPQTASIWSWRRDSNPRPSDYKSDALPTELRQQLGKGALPRKLIPRIPSRCPGQLYKVPQR
jgi:hypothetical protein